MAQMNGQQQQQHSSRRARRTASRDALKSSLSVPMLSPAKSEPALLDPHATPDLDYMEPAMEGPPSPERLRQLSKQMKRASYLNRPRLHRQQSTGSSPRQAMERSPCEQAFENVSLSRNPSSRSNSSGAPSELRTSRESVQILGRSLFQRGYNASNKYKRASSSHSSSNSSLYSAETTGEAFPKDSLIPAIFSRRKPSRDDTAEKRLQISGPFNFQHVTHTHRDELRRGRRVDTTAELSALRTPGPTTAPGVLQIEAQDLHHFHHMSTDSVQSEFDDAPSAASPSRPSFASRHTAPVVGSRPGMRSAKSSDQLRTNPPRSSQLLLRSQSPTEYGNTEPTGFAPVPPPRLSSRQSLTPESFSAFGPAAADRPRTSGGFRKPKPFDPSAQQEVAPPPPATSHGFMPPADFEALGNEGDTRFSHAVTAPDDAAWPLACPQLSPSFDKALPDVPEEEEQHGVLGRSRLSIASNSSLRGSQSVPALRSFACSSRPMSGHSETLGPIDVKAQPDSRVASGEGPSTPASPTNGSWEDAIDYCYEHEADANFDYQWDRPSLDSARAPVLPSPQPAPADAGLSEASLQKGHGGSLPALTEESVLDSAVSSFGNQSPSASQDTLAPNHHLTVSSNFSLPRGDKGGRIAQLKGVRPVSYASSFRESHGFNLSPSLLIPGDFHQQMLAERFEYHDDEILRGPYHDEISPGEERSPLSYQQRSSTSTTHTISSTQTDDRHVSANSAFTAMTRLTTSSSNNSLNKAAGIITEVEPLPVATLVEVQDHESDDADLQPTPPVEADTVPELPPMRVANFARKPMHRSHASESIVREDMNTFKAQDAARLRRPRARTSSLSAQVAPPVGQYALFPRSHIKGNGERI